MTWLQGGILSFTFKKICHFSTGHCSDFSSFAAFSEDSGKFEQMEHVGVPRIRLIKKLIQKPIIIILYFKFYFQLLTFCRRLRLKALMMSFANANNNEGGGQRRISGK